MSKDSLAEIHSAFERGLAIPYLGPGVTGLLGEGSGLPASADVLVGRLTANASVPHKIRNNLSAAAQFIENFKHRKTVAKAMTDAFTNSENPTKLHLYLASLPSLPLLVHAWYDDLPQKALAGRPSWGVVQGVSQTEHFGHWVHYFRPDGSRVPNPPETGFTVENVAPSVAPAETLAWKTLLYQPLGSVSPATNFLVSDTDFVEVLTEIDIQTPIPEQVQNIRKGRHFLFLGCRFAHQLDRLFARQVMKRSSDRHWAVLPNEPTKNEARFLAQQGIERIAMELPDFVEAFIKPRETAEAWPLAANS